MNALSSGMYQYVDSEGPMDARIVLLGESPWVNEVAAGRPFAGASGNLLKRWWAEPGVGLRRENMRIMNLFPWRPPAREIDSVPVDKLVKAIEGVHERLAKLRDPYVIVPMGNYAAYALTGKGKVKAQVRNAFSMGVNGVSEAEKKAGITQLRGSIYPYRDLNGRLIKVIPTIHPAAVLQMPKWEKRSVCDWGRISREAGFREIRQPQRQHIINPTESQIAEFIYRVYQAPVGARMSVDIETWGNTLSCVGFALTPYESITIPTTGAGKHDNLIAVKTLCESQVTKVLCNGTYDWYWLDAYDVRLNNYWLDVQSMHHALDPAEKHSLDFLASIYCPHYVYWKDEAKDAEEIVKYARDLDSLYVYNGMDCCYTRELVDILECELRREGMWEFYIRHYGMMFEPLIRTMRHGMRVDVEAQKAEAKRLKGELGEIHRKLNEMAGGELFASEEKTELREPTHDEWDKLIKDGDDKWSLVGEIAPPAKCIDREARARLKEQGLTYMINGKDAGKIRYKVSKVKKDFSTDKLLEFFYVKLGLPKQFVLRKKKTQKEKTVSLDEAAIRKLMAKYQKAVEPGKLLLEYREKKKERDYMRGAWDSDGRIRCSYKMNTRAGRLSSSSNPMRRGYNLQNLKRG